MGKCWIFYKNLHIINKFAAFAARSGVAGAANVFAQSGASTQFLSCDRDKKGKISLGCPDQRQPCQPLDPLLVLAMRFVLQVVTISEK